MIGRGRRAGLHHASTDPIEDLGSSAELAPSEMSMEAAEPSAPLPARRSKAHRAPASERDSGVGQGPFHRNQECRSDELFAIKSLCPDEIEKPALRPKAAFCFVCLLSDSHNIIHPVLEDRNSEKRGPARSAAPVNWLKESIAHCLRHSYEVCGGLI